tara:strand:- start:416 stop:1447 length:1032 start_codon:yes stop_codon:yes gene_type:complete
MTKAKNKRLAQIWRSVEQMLDEPVLDIKTPGGSARASCRVVLRDRTVIATSRPNFRRTHVEARVLKNLSAICPHVPKFIALQDNVLLQSDVGGKRLSETVHATNPGRRKDLAADAVDAIFRIHQASRTALDGVTLPPLGNSDTWISALVEGAEVLDQYGETVSDRLDTGALAEALQAEPRQFVKWDCRSGNAAVNPANQLCWFDFEYCGRRHGAEDLAWLIGDESWPVFPEDMFEIVKDNFPKSGFGPLEGYMDYLALYTTFHALKRLELVLDETKRRGWRTKARIIERDDVGRNPEFGANICIVGAYCADRSALTKPLVNPFLRAASHFADILYGRSDQKSA